MSKARFAVEDHDERDLPGGGRWWYVKWQKIRDRLNNVCPEDWQVSYDEPRFLDKYCYVTCTLIICGVTRSAIGSAQIEQMSKGGRDMSRGNPIERAVADAFKNCAESFGIAAYLDDQTDDKAKASFARYMHRNGNSKPAVQMQNEQRQTPKPATSSPPAKPFGSQSQSLKLLEPSR